MRIWVSPAIVTVVAGSGYAIDCVGAKSGIVDVTVMPLFAITTPEGEREMVPMPGMNVAGALRVSVWPLKTVASVKSGFVGVGGVSGRGLVLVMPLLIMTIPEGEREMMPSPGIVMAGSPMVRGWLL